MEEVLLNVMYEVPSREDVAKVVVTSEVVLENVNPTLIPRDQIDRKRERARRRPDRGQPHQSATPKVRRSATRRTFVVGPSSSGPTATSSSRRPRRRPARRPRRVTFSLAPWTITVRVFEPR
jgi:hypothetical protein